jgi:TPR repeat protein
LPLDQFQAFNPIFDWYCWSPDIDISSAKNLMETLSMVKISVPVWVKISALFSLALFMTSVQPAFSGNCSISSYDIDPDECETDEAQVDVQDLSEEVLLHVFSFLDSSDLAKARQVNRQWNSISQDRLLHPLYYRDGLKALERKEYEKARALFLMGARGLKPENLSRILQTFENTLVTCPDSNGVGSMLKSLCKMDPHSRFFTAELVSLYNETANTGDPVAQANLGRMYWFGIGVKKDFKVAKHYFELAANQGHAGAQNFLGWMYETSRESGQQRVSISRKFREMSYKRAIYYYELAADQEHVGAQYSLGSMYFDGRGVEKNLEAARYYFELAAAQGHSDAKNMVSLGF